MRIQVSRIYDSEYPANKNYDILKNKKSFEEYELVKDISDSKCLKFENVNYKKNLKSFFNKNVLPYLIITIILAIIFKLSNLNGGLIFLILFWGLVIYHIIKPEISKLNKTLNFNGLEVTKSGIFNLKNDSFFLNRVINYSENKIHFLALLPYSNGKSMIIILEDESEIDPPCISHNRDKSRFFVRYFENLKFSLKPNLLSNLLSELLKIIPSSHNNQIELDYEGDLKELIDNINGYIYTENQENISFSIDLEKNKIKLDKDRIESFLKSNNERF